jgi:predicted ferric reductase
MNIGPDVTRSILPPGRRRALEAALVALALAALAGMGWIAFGSPASGPTGPQGLSGWLASLGRVSGILATSLVLLQYLLSGRIKTLDRVFALNRLLLLHRGVAVTAAVLGTLHPLLLFAPETRTLGPFNPSAWPVYLGPLVLIGLWTVIATSLWRIFLGIPFHRWWLMHRLAVFTLVALVGVHAFLVGSDFRVGWPRTLLTGIFGAYLLFFLSNKIFKPLRMRSAPYTVSTVTPLSGKANMIEITPPGGRVFPYAPGQFSFVRFLSPAVSREEHHLAYAPEQGELLLIAAGIGITPLMSMLRHLADRRDPRDLTLIWSNRTHTDILFQDELEQMRSALPGLTVHHVLTREQDWDGPTGRLDKDMLGRLLGGVDRGCHVFLCGPPPMMDAVERGLTSLGFSGQRIHTERFAL